LNNVDVHLVVLQMNSAIFYFMGKQESGCHLQCGTIFSVAHTDISRTTRLSSVCVCVVSHQQLMVAVRWLNKHKLSVNV